MRLIVAMRQVQTTSDVRFGKHANTCMWCIAREEKFVRKIWKQSYANRAIANGSSDIGGSSPVTSEVMS